MSVPPWPGSERAEPVLAHRPPPPPPGAAGLALYPSIAAANAYTSTHAYAAPPAQPTAATAADSQPPPPPPAQTVAPGLVPIDTSSPIIRRGVVSVKDDGLRTWMWGKRWAVLRTQTLSLHKSEVRCACTLCVHLAS